MRAAGCAQGRAGPRGGQGRRILRRPSGLVDWARWLFVLCALLSLLLRVPAPASVHRDGVLRLPHPDRHLQRRLPGDVDASAVREHRGVYAAWALYSAAAVASVVL